MRRFTHRDKDARTPYKPLLLLWLIGRLAAGQPVEVSFKDAEFDLKLLMHRYRLGRSVRVAYPFVYLGQNRELWRVVSLSCCQVFLGGLGQVLRLWRLVGGLGFEHGEDDVAAASGDADHGGVVAFAF